jgi:hypothetical protein
MDISSQKDAWWKGDWVRLSIAILATCYFAYYTVTAHDWHLIDSVNLLIHEAGHIIFLPFGDFLHILGGSLFQTVFPMLYVGYFYAKQQYFSASLLVFWMGQNLLNVSIYASDAVVMQLPLLGGDTSGHDWHNILSMLNLLPYTTQIGSLIYCSGLVVLALAAYFSILTSQQSK